MFRKILILFLIQSYQLTNCENDDTKIISFLSDFIRQNFQKCDFIFFKNLNSSQYFNFNSLFTSLNELELRANYLINYKKSNFPKLEITSFEVSPKFREFCNINLFILHHLSDQ